MQNFPQFHQLPTVYPTTHEIFQGWKDKLDNCLYFVSASHDFEYRNFTCWYVNEYLPAYAKHEGIGHLAAAPLSLILQRGTGLKQTNWVQ